MFQFQDAEILMCYFHLLQNVKKHKNLVHESEYEDLLSDIQGLHYSKNQEEFEDMFRKFTRKWNKNKEFLEYLSKQWVNIPSENT